MENLPHIQSCSQFKDRTLIDHIKLYLRLLSNGYFELVRRLKNLSGAMVQFCC